MKLPSDLSNSIDVWTKKKKRKEKKAVENNLEEGSKMEGKVENLN